LLGEGDLADIAMLVARERNADVAGILNVNEAAEFVAGFRLMVRWMLLLLLPWRILGSPSKLRCRSFPRSVCMYRNCCG